MANPMPTLIKNGAGPARVSDWDWNGQNLRVVVAMTGRKANQIV
jgi:hypothetical protein